MISTVDLTQGDYWTIGLWQNQRFGLFEQLCGDTRVFLAVTRFALSSTI